MNKETSLAGKVPSILEEEVKLSLEELSQLIKDHESTKGNAIDDY